MNEVLSKFDDNLWKTLKCKTLNLKNNIKLWNIFACLY